MTDSSAGADQAEVVPAGRRLPVVPDGPDMRKWAEALVERARADGVALTGEGGLLTALMGHVLQTLIISATNLMTRLGGAVGTAATARIRRR